MKLNFREMTALLKVGTAMVLADGRVDDNESYFLSHEFASFGVPLEDMKKMTEAAEKMKPSEALAIISLMDDEQKRYVASFLGTIMASDGDIDEKEIALWRMLTEICDLPIMSIKEAIKYVIN